MAQATFEVVVQKLQLHETPTLERAMVYWLGLLVCKLLLYSVTWKLQRYYPIRRGKLDLHGLNVLHSLSPGLVVQRYLRGATAHYPRAALYPALLDDLAGHRYLYGLIAIDGASEELFFRGVPLLAALSLGFSQFAAVTIGTLIWVIGHDIEEFPIHLLAGAFYGWLWLSGAWYLAVAIHVFTNCFAHTWGRIAWWSTNGRYPA